MARRLTVLVLTLAGCGDALTNGESTPVLSAAGTERRVLDRAPTNLWPVCAADVDGDGRDEFIVWVLRDGGVGDLGVLDDGQTLSDVPLLVREGVSDDVHCLGDVNRDGLADVLVDGSIHLGHWRDGLSAEHGWEDPGDGVAFVARAAGDVDRDGHADLLVLSPDPTRGPYLHLGVETGVSPVPVVDLASTSGEVREVHVGDANGDRRPDVLLGGRWSARLEGPSYSAVTWQAVFWSWDLDTQPPGRLPLLEMQSVLPTDGECRDAFGSSEEAVAVVHDVVADGVSVDAMAIVRSVWTVPLEDCRTRSTDTLRLCTWSSCEDVQSGVSRVFAVDTDADGHDELAWVSGGVLWLKAGPGSVPHPLLVLDELGEVRELASGPRSEAGDGTLVARLVTEEGGEDLIRLAISLEDEDGDGFILRDCDDTDPDVFPGAEDVLGDGVDGNCDGVGAACRVDADQDGFFGSDLTELGSCYGPGRAPLSAPVLDCDDTSWDVFPGAEEDVGGVDRDCDGRDRCAVDGDGDGYAGGEVWSEAACAPLELLGVDDCDDADPRVNPGAVDPCDSGEDLDCDGFDGPDRDGDGWCAEAQGGPDCDDEDARVHPGAEERWYDGLDGDCDGADDFDQDGDGHRVGAWGGADCDDEDAGVGPSAEEIPDDGRDGDCDGTELCFVDADGDGFRRDAPVPTASLQCEGRGLVSGELPGGDCDDDDAGVNPGARDAWRRDGEDRDCDPSTSPGCSATGEAPTRLALLPLLVLVGLRTRRRTATSGRTSRPGR